MFKLVIIDDEKLIRDGLEKYIDWRSLDIEVAGTAADGDSALALIAEKRPDIILSDIKMPSMDGIEMLKILRERSFKCEVIFISAYSNFEYAQNAIKFGAFDYILKPIDENTLIEIVRKCTGKIKDALQQEHMLSTARTDIEKYTKQLLNNLLTGHIKLSEADKHVLYDTGIFPSNNSLMAAALIRCSDQSAYNASLVTGTIKDLLGASSLKYLVSGTMEYETVIILFPEITGMDNEYEIVKEYCDNIKDKLEKACPTVTVSLSGIHDLETDLNRLYMEASIAFLSGEFGMEENPKEFKGFLQKTNYKDITDPGSSKLLNFIKSTRKEGISSCLNELLLYFINTGTVYDMEMLKLEYSKVLDYIIDNLDEYAVKAQLSGKDGSTSFKKVISKQNNIIEIYEITKTILLNIINLLGNTPNRNNNRLVSLALDFIHKNYSTDITLNDVASHLYITPSYLSKIFSEEVKDNFSRYLLKYRVEMAKKLLKDPRQKVYEVSEMVGYTDVCHFTKVFKEIEGVTPAAYRKI